jgi:hypothetical protein
LQINLEPHIHLSKSILKTAGTDVCPARIPAECGRVGPFMNFVRRSPRRTSPNSNELFICQAIGSHRHKAATLQTGATQKRRAKYGLSAWSNPFPRLCLSFQLVYTPPTVEGLLSYAQFSSRQDLSLQLLRQACSGRGSVAGGKSTDAAGNCKGCVKIISTCSAAMS